MSEHKTCSTCPFNRSVERGALGGGNVMQFIGQANGPFYLPCHDVPGYTPENGRRGDMRGKQCVGAAKFRANLDKQQDTAGIMRLPKDTETVFGTFAEFLSHHESVELEKCEAFMNNVKPDMMTQVEMYRAGRGGSIVAVPRKESP